MKIVGFMFVASLAVSAGFVVTNAVISRVKAVKSAA